MRLAVYTCVTGGYDELAVPEVSSPGVNFYCFSDRKLSLPPPWRSVVLDARGLVHNEMNRYAKMLPHRLPEVRDCDASIYLDASIVVRADMMSYAELKLEKADSSVLMFPHPYRKTLFDEAASISDAGHEWVWRVAQQMRRYGKPPDGPLFAGGVIVRRHDERAARFGEIWWSEFLRETRRDQLSLTRAAAESGIAIDSLGPPDPFFEQRFFRLRPHRTRNTLRKSLRRAVNLAIAIAIGYPRLFSQTPPPEFVHPARKILRKLASSRRET